MCVASVGSARRIFTNGRRSTGLGGQRGTTVEAVGGREPEAETDRSRSEPGPADAKGSRFKKIVVPWGQESGSGGTDGKTSGQRTSCLQAGRDRPIDETISAEAARRRGGITERIRELVAKHPRFGTGD